MEKKLTSFQKLDTLLRFFQSITARIDLGQLIQEMKNIELIKSQDELLPMLHTLEEDGYILRVKAIGYEDAFVIKPEAANFIGYEETDIENKKNKELQQILNKSTIDVNASITATNKAIAVVNKRMLEHANAQEKIMKAQNGFYEQQVEIMGKQTKLITTQTTIYKYTLILTGLSILLTIILLIITINSNSDKELISIQRLQLRDQYKEIQRLQLLKSDTVHYVLYYPLPKNKGIKKP